MSQPQGPPTGSPRSQPAKATPPEVDNDKLRRIVTDTYSKPGDTGISNRAGIRGPAPTTGTQGRSRGFA